MYYGMERTIIYAPSSYLFGAGVIFIVLAILALAVGWPRRGSEFFRMGFERIVRWSGLQACSRNRISDRSRSRRGGWNRGDFSGRAAIAGSMN
jgi:hypothetical protein